MARTYDRLVTLERMGVVKNEYGDDIAGYTQIKDQVPLVAVCYPARKG